MVVKYVAQHGVLKTLTTTQTLCALYTKTDITLWIIKTADMMTGTCKDIIKLPYSVTIEKEFDLDLNAFKKYLWKHYEHDADYIWDNINIILDEYSRSKNHIIPYESLACIIHRQ